jgi:antitoxin (DNA-binding transcriptional repressor) of toxin-antitoxin stability system
MIQANISEIKNRLSYYLKLVKGGEQVEILDRKTPLARIVHVAQTRAVDDGGTAWIKEVAEMGIVDQPQLERIDPGLLRPDSLSGSRDPRGAGVLDSLLEEREYGR